MELEIVRGAQNIGKIVGYGRREVPRLVKDEDLPAKKKGQGENAVWCGLKGNLLKWRDKHFGKTAEKDED
ncbi:MAG: hypothetical protein JW724_03205 [Candidatus Altiarchaeota archaeon]|nr:hypothetical protein [Candidatus Altiarchaeota archaeon]